MYQNDVAMRFFSYPLHKCKTTIASFLSHQKIWSLARATGFVIRRGRAFNPTGLLTAFLHCLSGGTLTLSNWARLATEASGIKEEAGTKQSLSERLGPKAAQWAEKIMEAMLQSTLAKALERNLQKLRKPKEPKSKKGKKQPCIFSLFKDIILQDSTVVSLPDGFGEHYAGSFCRFKKTAQMRIQTVMSLKDFSIAHLSLHPYRKNDQSAAGCALPYLKKGALLLRDLGYFVLSSLREVGEAGACFLTRHRWGVKLYCTTGSGKELSLRTLCRQANKREAPLSLWVLAGSSEKLLVRVVITPLPGAVSAERRRRARGHRHSRTNHNAAYFECLGYSIMLTNAGEEKLPAEHVGALYELRWQIENLFKTFKSAGPGLGGLCKNLRTNVDAVRTFMYLGLACTLMLLGKVVGLLWPYGVGQEREAEARAQKVILVSLIKAMNWVWKNLVSFLANSPHQQRAMLLEYASYEQRKDRQNMVQKINNTMALT